MNDDIILETKGITKSFGSLIANDKIDLKVMRGTIHSIIGENGAGKSTLMNIIAGIIKPSKGEIYLNGKSVTFRNPNDAANNGIGMVHQDFMLYPELSVLDNLMMGFESIHYGVFLDKKKAKDEILHICKKYNFLVPLERMVKDLPVSVQQQVEIVKVLYKGADIIILDEPTAVLTPQGIEGLFEAIRNLVNQGKTIIMITHKLQEVMAISDYITVLKNGRVTGNVLPENVDEKILANLMVGHEVLFNTKKKAKHIGDPILRVENVSVDDDSRIEKVHNVSFSINKGEIVGIAGVAGSGQTELVEMLFGLRKASFGSVNYKGAVVTSHSPRLHRLGKVGYVPQDRNVTGTSRESTITENAIMGYHVAHGFTPNWLLNRHQAECFANEVVSKYSVKADKIGDSVDSLSGGNIQKLVVGREFLQNNDLLIIEDPTRGIDVGAIEFIWQKIIEISEAGTSILLISHELGEIMELSDRILVMFDGRIVGNLVNDTNLGEQEIGLYMLGGKRDAS